MSAKLRSDPHFAIILSIHLLANVFFIPIISRLFLVEPVLEIEAKAKQDRVNNANSAHLHDKPFNHSGLPKQFIWSGWSVGQVVLVA